MPLNITFAVVPSTYRVTKHNYVRPPRRFPQPISVPDEFKDDDIVGNSLNSVYNEERKLRHRSKRPTKANNAEPPKAKRTEEPAAPTASFAHMWQMQKKISFTSFTENAFEEVHDELQKTKAELAATK